MDILRRSGWILTNSPRTGKGPTGSAHGCADTVFFDVYDNKLILFSSIPYSIKVIEEQIQPILAGIREKDDTVSAFRSGNLQTTAEVREAYLCYEEYLADAKKIFPKRQWFTLGDIKFAKQCHETVDHGENYVNTMITTLAALHASDDDWNQAISVLSGTGLRYVWLGGSTYISNDGSTITASWLNGSNLSYIDNARHWYPNEPSGWDNSSPEHSLEPYILLWYVDDYWSLNDTSNDILKYYKPERIGYLCEFD